MLTQSRGRDAMAPHHHRQVNKWKMSGEEVGEPLERALLESWTRLPCPKCKRSYKFYCPVCCIPVGVPEGVAVPELALPVRVHVWFHDKAKKSTAPHAKVLARDDVEIIPFPINPEVSPQPATYTREDTVVVYPTPEADTIGDLPSETLQGIRNMVFIDSPWQKAPVILENPALAGLRCVKLANPPHESNFWRYHQAGAGCVSTIEAIELLLIEYVDAMTKAGAALPPRTEKTQLADLLFFFRLQFAEIAVNYEKDPKLFRKPPMDANEKERQRTMRNQKEAGKKRRLENKREAWEKVVRAMASGEIDKPPRHGKCFNCKKKGHESKDCPNPCRYCKQAGHYSGQCTMKRVCYEREQKEQQTVRTKAL